jgi:hypothetical protein
MLLLSISVLWSGVDAVSAEAGSGFTAPEAGETLSGVVEVIGTAVHPAFLRYELAFREEAAPERGWIVFAEGGVPVVNSTLAVWDTTVGRDIGAPVFPDGRYQLRLRVVKTDYNYDEYFLTDLSVFNAGPTPTPTADETAIAATAAANNVAATLPPASAGGFQAPTPLPSLTPFPTLTPQATAVRPAVATVAGAGSEEGGLLGDLAQADAGRVSESFWLGVRLTAGVFGLFLGYLLLRALVRRLWRKAWRRE